MKLFISKNDKGVLLQSFKILLEECLGDSLIIKDYKELDQYNLTLFPEEIAIIYYEPSMENHNKYHHLINNSKYVIIITDYSWTYENEPIMTIGFNQTFIPWFFNKTINYFKEKYLLHCNLDDNTKKLTINWIISKKFDPLQFCKIIFFTQNLSLTINYLECTAKQIKTHELKNYQTPFMYFYKTMMTNYGGKGNDSTDYILSNIITFNNIYK